MKLLEAAKSTNYTVEIRINLFNQNSKKRN